MMALHSPQNSKTVLANCVLEKCFIQNEITVFILCLLHIHHVFIEITEVRPRIIKESRISIRIEW